MYRHIAAAVYKRATGDEAGAIRPPGWAWGVVALDLVIFLPVFLFIGYTLLNVFPVLAMIEDPSPPAYEPVSLNEDTQSLAEENPNAADGAARGPQDTRATTSSFRATYRALYAVSGWTSLFRGLGAYFAFSVATAFVYGIISAVPYVPRAFAAVISALALVQPYTAWVHIVISAPSSKAFWQRLPPFKRAFSAAALPTVVYFVALEIQQSVPKLLAKVLRMNVWDPKHPNNIPQPDASDSWKGLVVVLTSIVLAVGLTVPTLVVLTRVQASLLPEEDETIVPFDRSFQSKVEPAIVGGRGFVTPVDAWATFSRASWVRLVKLYLKIFAFCVVAYLAFAVVLIPEYILIARSSKKVE